MNLRNILEQHPEGMTINEIRLKTGMSYKNIKQGLSKLPIETDGKTYYLIENPKHRLEIQKKIKENRPKSVVALYSTVQNTKKTTTEIEQPESNVINLGIYDQPTQSDSETSRMKLEMLECSDDDSATGTDNTTDLKQDELINNITLLNESDETEPLLLDAEWDESEGININETEIIVEYNEEFSDEHNEQEIEHHVYSIDSNNELDSQIKKPKPKAKKRNAGVGALKSTTPYIPNRTRGYEVIKGGRVKIFLTRRASSRTLTLDADDLKELIKAVEKTDRNEL